MMNYVNHHLLMKVLKPIKVLKDCLKEETYELHSGIEKKRTFDKNSIMLLGDYGGITIGDYFKKDFANV